MSFQSWQRVRAETTRREIDAFTESAGLVQRNYTHLGRTMLILDRPELAPIDEIVAQDYVAQHIDATRERISNNCYRIARNSLAQSRPTGILYGLNLSRFMIWANHYINYEELDDGSTLVTDLTASANLDYDQGVYHVLGIRAVGDMRDVCRQVGDLYTGGWMVRDISRPPDDLWRAK